MARRRVELPAAGRQRSASRSETGIITGGTRTIRRSGGPIARSQAGESTGGGARRGLIRGIEKGDTTIGGIIGTTTISQIGETTETGGVEGGR